VGAVEAIVSLERTERVGVIEIIATEAIETVIMTKMIGTSVVMMTEPTDSKMIVEATSEAVEVVEDVVEIGADVVTEMIVGLAMIEIKNGRRRMGKSYSVRL
jgi:hypothetical protein